MDTPNSDAKQAPAATSAHCNRCGPGTNHHVLYSERVEWEDFVEYNDGGGFHVEGTHTYELLKCGGCDSVRLRHTETCSDWSPGERHIIHYPPIISRKAPNWVFETIPREAKDLLEEIYRALHADSRRLAAMGIRSLIEVVMTEKVRDRGTFKATLIEFHKEGWISDKHREVLDQTIQAGHAAIHRDYKPTPEDLSTLMDIAEALIASVYVHPARGEALSKKIPQRT